MRRIDESVESELRLPHQQYRSDINPVLGAKNDLWAGLIDVRLWTTLAWEGFVDRYRRSYFGALWAILSFIVFSLAILFFMGTVSGQSAEDFTAYTVIGFLMFQLLSSLMLDGSQVFIQSRTWIASVRVPLSAFVFTSIARTMIVFVFNSIGALIILFSSGYRFPLSGLWAAPGLLVVILSAVWVYLVIGTITTRFRDVLHLTQTFMRMAFFVTPIMWTTDGGGTRSLIANLNPLTHYMEIVRAPLLGGAFPITSWIIVGCFSAVGIVLSLAVFSIWRKHIALWL